VGVEETQLELYFQILAKSGAMLWWFMQRSSASIMALVSIGFILEVGVSAMKPVKAFGWKAIGSHYT